MKAAAVRDLNSGSDVDIAACLRDAMERRDGRIVRAEGQIYRFDRTHWTPYQHDFLRREVHRFDGMTLATTRVVKIGKPRVDSILHELGAMVAEPEFFKSARAGVNCANGFTVFDPDGRPAQLPHDPEHRARHVLSAAWDKNLNWRTAPSLNKLLVGCFRDDDDRDQRVDLIGELFGASVLGCATMLRQPLAFVLHGATANNGKSQIIECARGLLPPSAITSISPSRFHDPQMMVCLVGVNLNTAGELGSATSIASDDFKSAVTGDAATGKHVYERPFEFRPTALHLFATNNLPRFNGGLDRGVRRRLMVIPFTRSIPADEMVPNLARLIVSEEDAGLLAFAIEGAGRLIRRGEFTEPPSCRQALVEWTLSSDPVMGWYAERAEFNPGSRWVTPNCYSDFKCWARQEGFDEKILPAVNNFVRKLLENDARLGRVKSNNLRFIVGLRLRAADA